MKNLLTTISLIACVAAMSASQAAKASDWPMFGQNLSNTADGKGETAISIRNVSALKPKWVATTGGDLSARAAVVGGVVYFPDWVGNLWALNGATGKPVWSHKLSDYGLPSNAVARDTPAVVDGTLYVGTFFGATLLAIDAATGTLKWHTRLDIHPQAVITSSPAVNGGVLYIGVSSFEEAAAANPNYKCCSFRGSVVAVDTSSGKMLWKTRTAPLGYAGAAVWGSNPVVDAKLNAIFVGTGDNYMKPTAPAYLTCIANGGTEPTCMSPDNHVDSILSLDMTTGKIRWARRFINDDDWNVACETDMPGVGNCPVGAGRDYDFGADPNLLTITPAGSPTPVTIVGIGQKSGIYAAFNADTGRLVWATRVGPGSFLGGMEWGTATDGRRIYVAITNWNHKPYSAGNAGSWSALDPATGKILWQTPDPNGSIDPGPMAVANGVVYAPSMAAGTGQPNMFALDAWTGKVLWSYNSGGSVIAGAAISGGVVYWGSGYAGLSPIYKGNNQFYAFSINGQ